MFKKLKQIFAYLNLEIKDPKLNLKKYNWIKILKVLAVTIAMVASLLVIKDEIEYHLGLGFWADYDEEELDNNYYEDEEIEEKSGCNVTGINLHGGLVTYIPNENMECSYGECYQLVDEVSSENIVFAIEEAENDNIKAILIEIDSHGGMPVADEEVANALKQAKKPTVVLIRSTCLSSAYYAATGADIIFASQDSDVGSIGVTYSYLDYAKQNQNEGITFNQVSSGKYKDLMNPDKSLTSEEKALLMRDVKIMNENFIKAVAENRNLEIDKVRKLADGSSMLGQMALENGLIDRIGGYYEVEEYLKELIGEDIEICWQ